MVKVHNVGKTPFVLTNTKPASANEITVPIGQTKVKKTPEFREMRYGESYEQYKKERADYNFKNDIKSGKLEYVEPTKIFGKEFGGRYFRYHADKGETLGDVKGRYNLPAGILRKFSSGGGGDFDRHEAPSSLTIDETVMEQALQRQIKHKDVQTTITD